MAKYRSIIENRRRLGSIAYTRKELGFLIKISFFLCENDKAFLSIREGFFLEDFFYFFLL